MSNSKQQRTGSGYSCRSRFPVNWCCFTSCKLLQTFTIMAVKAGPNEMGFEKHIPNIYIVFMAFHNRALPLETISYKVFYFYIKKLCDFI